MSRNDSQTITNYGRRKWMYAFFCLCFIGALLAVDQWTKHLAVEYLSPKNHPEGIRISFLPNILSFYYVENRGVAFGLLSGKETGILLSNTLILLCFLGSMARLIQCGKKKSLPVLCLMSVMCAGAVGNMIDRFRLGYVIDFIRTDFMEFPVFNVADIYVTCSVILLFMLVVFYYKDDEITSLFSRRKI